MYFSIFFHFLLSAKGWPFTDSKYISHPFIVNIIVEHFKITTLGWNKMIFSLISMVPVASSPWAGPLLWWWSLCALITLTVMLVGASVPGPSLELGNRLITRSLKTWLQKPLTLKINHLLGALLLTLCSPCLGEQSMTHSSQSQ